MVARGVAVPPKLSPDAIVEALLEIRFDGIAVPEVFFGRLADQDPWNHLEQRRLPASDFPAVIRQQDPNLRYTPLFEFTDSKSKALRVGANALSFHRLAPYMGWDSFWPELEGVIDALFNKNEALVVNRLGLRYINILSAQAHGVASINDLDIELQISGDRLRERVNLNFMTDMDKDSSCTIRVATAEFVQGIPPPPSSVVIDIDVYTKEGYGQKNKAEIKNWVLRARTKKNEEFFHLLKQKTIEALRVK
jgi:uncharacterized protein (TIGR04255 family)